MPILRIECGQEIKTDEQPDMDLASGGTNRRSESNPNKEFVIFAYCPIDPLPPDERFFISLTVPSSIDISGMKDRSAAEAKLLSGGEVPYKCSRFGTPHCPLYNAAST